MQSKRSSRRTRRRRNSTARTNKIFVLKLVDPIIQSLLFILYIYCLDSTTELPHEVIFYFILGWQILSGATNLLTDPPDQLKKARIAFTITLVLYTLICSIVLQLVQEKNISIQQPNVMTIPLHEAIFETGGIIISFLYYIICFREIRTILTRMSEQRS
jgi:hypothetical protein